MQHQRCHVYFLAFVLQAAVPEKELSKPRRTAAEQRAYLDRLLKPREWEEVPSHLGERLAEVQRELEPRRTAAEQRAYLDQLLKPRDLEPQKELSKPRRTAAEQRAYLDQLLRPREWQEIAGIQNGCDPLKEQNMDGL